MTIVRFRVDASFEIGLGHFSRCFALAEGFERAGCEIRFYMSQVPERVVSKLTSAGYSVRRLPSSDDGTSCGVYEHSSWLANSERADAMAFEKLVFEEERQLGPSIVVVDHYGIGSHWERHTQAIGHILAIDDLSDRPHHCSWLLDQTFGKSNEDYAGLVRNGCTLLVGAEYALLRRTFSQSRERALARRAEIHFPKNVLISMGGADACDQSSEILKALRHYDQELEIKLIVGAASEKLSALESLARQIHQPCEVLFDVSNMADLMTWADIGIGVGGTSSWERCVLGLPSIAICVAENQKDILANLSKLGALLELPLIVRTNRERVVLALKWMQAQPEAYQEMASIATTVCDGCGVERVVTQILNDVRSQDFKGLQ